MKINFEVDFDFQFPETIGKEEALEYSPMLVTVTPKNFPEDCICCYVFFEKDDDKEIYFEKIVWNYDRVNTSRFPKMLSDLEIDIILRAITDRARKYDFRDFEIEIND